MPVDEKPPAMPGDIYSWSKNNRRGGHWPPKWESIKGATNDRPYGKKKVG